MIIVNVITACCAIWELVANIIVSLDLYRGKFVEKSKVRQMELQTLGSKYKVFAIRTGLFLLSSYGWYVIVNMIIKML